MHIARNGIVQEDGCKPHTAKDYETFRSNIQKRFTEWADYEPMFEMYTQLIYKLAKARVKMGLSQVDMGIRMNTAQTNISKYEAGNALPSIYWLMRWADACGYELTFSLKPKKNTKC